MKGIAQKYQHSMNLYDWCLQEIVFHLQTIMMPMMLSSTTKKSRRFQTFPKYSEIPRPASLRNSSTMNTKVQKLSSWRTGRCWVSPGLCIVNIAVLTIITNRMNASKRRERTKSRRESILANGKALQRVDGWGKPKLFLFPNFLRKIDTKDEIKLGNMLVVVYSRKSKKNRKNKNEHF